MAAVDIFGMILKRGIQLRAVLACPCQHAAFQIVASCSLLQDNKGRREGQALPELVKLAPHTVCEEVGNIGAGVVVSLPAHLHWSVYVVAIFRLIEGHPHIFRERDWPLTLDA